MCRFWLMWSFWFKMAVGSIVALLVGMAVGILGNTLNNETCANIGAICSLVCVLVFFVSMVSSAIVENRVPDVKK